MILFTRVTSMTAAVAAFQNGADALLLSPCMEADAYRQVMAFARLRRISVTLDFTRAATDRKSVV